MVKTKILIMENLSFLGSTFLGLALNSQQINTDGALLFLGRDSNIAFASTTRLLEAEVGQGLH